MYAEVDTKTDKQYCRRIANPLLDSVQTLRQAGNSIVVDMMIKILEEILKVKQVGVRFGHFIKSENKTINTFMQELAIKSEFYGLPLYEEILEEISKGKLKFIKSKIRY